MPWVGGGAGRRNWISRQRGAFIPGFQNLNFFTSEIREMLVISLYYEDKYGISEGLAEINGGLFILENDSGV